MASHLTVISKAPSGTTAAKALNATNAAEAEPGVMGAFAAMLGGSDKGAGTKPTTESRFELSLSKLASLVLGTGNGEQTGADAQDPEALATVIDAAGQLPPTDQARALLTDLVNGLAALKQSLDAGETVDPELLAGINQALEGLATQFNIDLSAQPSLDDLSALTDALATSDDDTATIQLTQALVPLAQTMLAEQGGPGAAAELAATIKAVGEKLAALLQQINGGNLSADDLAAMGLQPDEGFDADLEAALARLINPAPKVDASTQTLAAPALKLTEPALTGKGDAASTTPAPAAETGETTDGQARLSATTAPQTDADTQDGANTRQGDEPKPVDAKPAPAAAATATAASEARSDTQPTPPAATQAARLDAIAPRVVQTGYQTSQQQLNLPQLAFELVRQVTDGNTRFQLRLDPPELGRIDVKLDIDKGGQINARLVVEKSETLDLMQRDQRALEKALQQAGLDGAKTNLEFSLKQNPFSGGQQGRDDQGQQFSLGGTGAEDLEEAPPTVNLYRGSLTASGVNIIA